MRTKAPGLTFKLERRFAAQVIDNLDRHYTTVEAAGGNYEHGLVREEGVSFNPRIARVASLMLEEQGNHATPEGIAAAMWALVEGDLSALAELDAAVYELVRAARGGGTTSPNQELVAAILGVRELDTIRHLHMTTRSVDDKREYLNRLKNGALLTPASALSESLRKKIEHAISMQERCLNAEVSEEGIER